MDNSTFSHLLDDRFYDILTDASGVAVAVSGGPDSMALARLVYLWGQARGVTVHALTVDHGLRAGAATEAAQVAGQVADWPGATHRILIWEGDKPGSRVQEEARAARYDLMADYCAAQGIRHLFVAHHRDDQAETFLFRLAKGSGLKGLACMRPVQPYGADLFLLRPLLGVSKDELIAFCAAEGLLFSQDPSNEDENYARIRLRKSRAVLEEEGLSAKRLAVMAARLSRADAALESVSLERLESIQKEKHTKRIVYLNDLWQKEPDEIGLRLIVKAIEAIGSGGDYLPRMEKIEDLCARLRGRGPFQTCTLGGVIFARDDAKNEIIMRCEHEE